MRKIVAALASALLAACSPHPLTEDTTGLRSYDIVQKIRCETRDAISFMLQDRGLVSGVPLLDAAEKRIKGLRDGLSKFDAETEELRRERAELITEKASFDLDLRNVTNKIALANLRNPGGQAPPGLVEELRSVRQKLIEWDTDASDYRRRANGLNAEISRVNKTIDHAEAEKRRKFKPLLDFYGHIVAYQFRFEITETNNAGASGKFMVPIHLGTFTVDFGGGALKERLSERTIKLSAGFKTLLEVNDCVAPARTHVRARLYPIVGDIGVAETVQQYLRVADTSKFTKAGESYIDEIQFTTTIDASAKPQVTLTPLSKHVISGTLDLSAKRKDLHEVIIYLSPAVPDTPTSDKVQLIRIVEDTPELGPSN